MAVNKEKEEFYSKFSAAIVHHCQLNQKAINNNYLDSKDKANGYRTQDITIESDDGKAINIIYKIDPEPDFTRHIVINGHNIYSGSLNALNSISQLNLPDRITYKENGKEMTKNFTQPSFLSRLISFIKKVVGYESSKNSDDNIHMRLRTDASRATSSSIERTSIQQSTGTERQDNSHSQQLGTSSHKGNNDKTGPSMNI